MRLAVCGRCLSFGGTYEERAQLQPFERRAFGNVYDPVPTPLECFHQSERVKRVPAKARWQVHTTTADRPTPTHKGGESRGRVPGKRYEKQAVRTETVCKRGVCQHSDATRSRSRSARDAIFWTALTTLQSATMGSGLLTAESAETTASSQAKLEMASSQNLRYRSSPGQSRSTDALGWPSSTGQSGLIPTSLCLPAEQLNNFIHPRQALGPPTTIRQVASHSFRPVLPYWIDSHPRHPLGEVKSIFVFPIRQAVSHKVFGHASGRRKPLWRAGLFARVSTVEWASNLAEMLSVFTKQEISWERVHADIRKAEIACRPTIAGTCDTRAA